MSAIIAETKEHYVGSSELGCSYLVLHDFYNSDKWKEISEREKDKAGRECYFCGKHIEHDTKEEYLMCYDTYESVVHCPEYTKGIIVLCNDCYDTLDNILTDRPYFQKQLKAIEENSEEFIAYKQHHLHIYAKYLANIIEKYYPNHIAGHSTKIATALISLWDGLVNHFGCIKLGGENIANQVAHELKERRENRK